MSNILVTSIGSASAECVILQLKKANNHIIGTNIYDKEFTYCSILVDVFYKVSKSNSPQFISEILDICNKENIQYIIPLTDLEIDAFNTSRRFFELNNVIVCFSDYECINICRNKRLSSSLVDSLNVCKVPKEISGSDIAEGFPVICKKINGRSSEGIEIIRSYEEYELFKNYLNEEYIIQEFIEGNVITVDLLRYKNIVVSVSREEYVRTANGLGISVRTFVDQELDKIVHSISAAMNIIGCVNFEFIKSDNGYFFLECNPRFSGGINFSILSGYDFVINHLHCFSHGVIDKTCNTCEHVINRKYSDFIYSGDQL